MRARDARAIAFCVVSTGGVIVGAWLLLHSYAATLALTAAYGAWLLTRARMVRVMRRLRGQRGWTVYFDNKGGRLTPPPSPGRGASSPRPAERR